MWIDSHCHVHLMTLTEPDETLDQVMQEAHEQGVEHLLSVCVELNEVPALRNLAEMYPQVSTSVGVHPDTDVTFSVTEDDLVRLAEHRSCVAIGETGLDYYRTTDLMAQEVQQVRFREHIRASRRIKKPLIIHTRQAAEDTLRLMQEEQASEIGGVMHCFSEDWDIARRALDLNFYISFSGVITFKNADALRTVAEKVPLDRILIETDSPYLAPVPFRGKPNRPAWVTYVGKALSALRGVDEARMAQITTDNFYRCFRMKPA